MILTNTNIAKRTREIALTLTSWPSVTGSADEASFAHRLVDYLQGFDTSWVAAIAGDPAGRSNVFALKRGKTNRTVVLTGHFDVVPIEDYGSLKHLACDAEKLLPETIAKLRLSGENALALADFESGDFLPGRGLLDMKAGLAAGLAAAESYHGEATLLFVAVSDEEERSAGARSAAPQLAAIAAHHNLDIRLIINLDAISDQGDGATGRVVTLGSIGKQLVTALVVGKEAHAGYPQDGANAAYLAAELIRAFEVNPALSESTGDEVAAPPTCLAAKDLKQGYNVTTPAAMWVYWNTMQHQRSGDEVFVIAQRLARTAMAEAAIRVKREVPVISYADLAARVAPERLATLAQDIASHTQLDFPERCKLMTEKVWALSGLSGPCVVLGFGSIPYPAVALTDAKLTQNIIDAVSPHGLGHVTYFAGISDMSFLGEASGDLKAVAANTPIWGTSFVMPEAAGYPCVNIGPWGRDYHHWLERVHAPYAFETLPRVLLSVIEAVTKSG